MDIEKKTQTNLDYITNTDLNLNIYTKLSSFSLGFHPKPSMRLLRSWLERHFYRVISIYILLAALHLDLRLQKLLFNILTERPLKREGWGEGFLVDKS